MLRFVMVLLSLLVDSVTEQTAAPLPLPPAKHSSLSREEPHLQTFWPEPQTIYAVVSETQLATD